MGHRLDDAVRQAPQRQQVRADVRVRDAVGLGFDEAMWVAQQPQAAPRDRQSADRAGGSRRCYSRIRPRRIASTTASVRVDEPSFIITPLTWNLAV